MALLEECTLCLLEQPLRLLGQTLVTSLLLVLLVAACLAGGGLGVRFFFGRDIGGTTAADMRRAYTVSPLDTVLGRLLVKAFTNIAN